MDETIKHYQKILESKESQITELKYELSHTKQELRSQVIQVSSLERKMESLNELCEHYRNEVVDKDDRIKLLRIVAIGSFAIALGILIVEMVLNS